MVFGVNGNNNINQAAFQKINLGHTKEAAKAAAKPIDMTFKSEGSQIGRTDLDNLSKIDSKTLELQGIADATNTTLASLGCNIKVTPAQVASVEQNLAGTTLPALALAGEHATEARIANPDGPFAELFSAIA